MAALPLVPVEEELIRPTGLRGDLGVLKVWTEWCCGGNRANCRSNATLNGTILLANQVRAAILSTIGRESGDSRASFEVRT